MSALTILSFVATAIFFTLAGYGLYIAPKIIVAADIEPLKRKQETGKGWEYEEG